MAYYVYLLANRKHGTLYAGVTNDLARRSFEHKTKAIEGFTARYDIDKVVCYEVYETALDAIAREKQVKHWKREWKVKRIEEINPDWKDLSLTFNQ